MVSRFYHFALTDKNKTRRQERKRKAQEDLRAWSQFADLAEKVRQKWEERLGKEIEVMSPLNARVRSVEEASLILPSGHACPCCPECGHIPAAGRWEEYLWVQHKSAKGLCMLAQKNNFRFS